MDTILYLYPVRKTTDSVREQRQIRKENCKGGWWGKLRTHFPGLWITTGDDGAEQPELQVIRTEYFFPEYRLVKAAVAGYAGHGDRRDGAVAVKPGKEWGKDRKWMERRIEAQLRELTEDPDHTYVVCREPLSFYFGREFREYLQQNWVEHLLRYGEKADGCPKYPDLVILGRNAFLTYVVLRYAEKLRRVGWYLTERQYREEEDWLVEELEEEYGLIPGLHLLATDSDYRRIRLQDTEPCVVLDFCDNEKIYGADLGKGSIWLDFTASEEKERRFAIQCPGILYFSLKKEWKEPRKALEYLDTISKNGYNNSVD